MLRPLTGWSVTDLLPAGLSLESITGEGHTCTGATCVAAAPLAGGAQGPVPTVTAIIEDDVVGALTTIARVTPAEGDVTETIPLVVPTSSTETEASATDNDAEAPVPVDEPIDPVDPADPEDPEDPEEPTTPTQPGTPAAPSVSTPVVESSVLAMTGLTGMGALLGGAAVLMAAGTFVLVAVRRRES